jgi:hypothetical protein
MVMKRVDHASAVRPWAQRSLVVRLAHAQDGRSRAQDEPGLRLGRQRQTQVPMLMSFRYAGEGQDVIARQVVCRRQDQRLIGRAQFDGTDVLEQNVEVLGVGGTGTGMQQ